MAKKLPQNITINISPHFNFNYEGHSTERELVGITGDTEPATKRARFHVNQHSELPEVGLSTARFGSSLHRYGDDTDGYTVITTPKESYQQYLEKPAYYQITHPRPKKGRVLIINNEFRGQKRQRNGSRKDVNDLTDVWEGLDASVISNSNLSGSQIKDEMREFISQTRDVDFCAVFIMSHGTGDDLVVGNDGSRVDAQELVNLFTPAKCRHLCGIPKLLFFHMCRGPASSARFHSGPVEQIEGGFFDEAVTGDNWLENLIGRCLPLGETLGKAGEDEIDASPCTSGRDELDRVDEERAVREMPDMMLTFSTLYGEPAVRNSETGAWLVQALCQVFSQRAHDTDLVGMMNIVNPNVANRISASNKKRPNLGGKNNRVITKHSLQKKLRFYPGWP